MKKAVTSKRSRTDWGCLDALKDKDIDFSDVPEVPPKMFARAIVRQGLKPVPRKGQLTLRVDSDVLHWFRNQGQGYQTKINALLRAYMNAHKASSFPRFGRNVCWKFVVEQQSAQSPVS
ncbi:MAG TPA: BrnA antitoxin family protein [Pyrinomonadaceae bacterium]|nr:BrnA antitoxin family protein [Pyrinomonadaceae bacterium]